MIGGIRTCLAVSDDPMLRWISSNSCPLNLLFVRSHQAQKIIVKRLIQKPNSVTRVGVERRPFDQGHRKYDAFIHSATLQTSYTGVEINFFNNLPVGQVISNVYLPEKISTCPKKKGTISFEFNFGKTFVKCTS